jgi:predicted NBD/HSP70 family sugar kinase
MLEEAIGIYETPIGHVRDSKSDHSIYSRLAGVGNLIPQSIADDIEDMAQENYAVRVKAVGIGIGMVVHVRPRW